MPFDPRGPHTASDWESGPEPSGFQGGAGVATPGFDFPDHLPQDVNLFLPEERPIPSAIVFNTLGFATTAIVQTNVFLANAAFDLPDGWLGRIDSVTFYVANLLLASNITFTVFQNRTPVQGLANVPVFPGVSARVAENLEVYIRVPNGQLLEVAFNNNDGGTYTVGAALSGWIWPEQDGRRWVQRGASY